VIISDHLLSAVADETTTVERYAFERPAVQQRVRPGRT
jgi:hypothetical protein